MSCLELITNAAVAAGTVGSAFAAVYYGSIKPARQTAKFDIIGFRKTDFFSEYDFELLNNGGDMLEVGFFVEQKSGGPSSDVSILIKKIWYWENGEGERKGWSRFVPSTLDWAARGEVSFSAGTQRYCHLGFYGNPPQGEIVGDAFALAISENKGHALWGAHSNILPNHKGGVQMELLLSGINVQPKRFLLELKYFDIKKTLSEGKNIEDSVEVSVISDKNLG